MALTNAERQRRWIAKNRALHNLRRRKQRKVADSQSDELGRSVDQERLTNKPAQLSSDPKVNELRALIAKASAEPTVPVVKLSVYRDDYGRVITERQWNALQKRKAEAKDGGYEIDEFSQ